MVDVDTDNRKLNRTNRIRHNKSVMVTGNNDQHLLVSTVYIESAYQPSNLSLLRPALTSYRKYRANIWSTGRRRLREQTTKRLKEQTTVRTIRRPFELEDALNVVRRWSTQLDGFLAFMLEQNK